MHFSALLSPSLCTKGLLKNVHVHRQSIEHHIMCLHLNLFTLKFNIFILLNCCQTCLKMIVLRIYLYVTMLKASTLPYYMKFSWHIYFTILSIYYHLTTMQWRDYVSTIKYCVSHLIFMSCYTYCTYCLHHFNFVFFNREINVLWKFHVIAKGSYCHHMSVKHQTDK